MPPSTSSRAHILVVEDQHDLAEALAYNLRHAGHRVDRACDGREALLMVRQRMPELILLDLNLPHVDGFTVLDRLRSSGVWVPVLILSARGAAADKVEGFRLGADDYVTKPFTVAELLARVTALLRRAGGHAAEPTFVEPTPVRDTATAGTDLIGYTDEALVARFTLTLRQAAVARLLAAGLNNREIAESLAISRFTVRNHVEQVLAKVGVPGRGRVAAALRAAYDADATPAA
jgi:DNA-binding response OmpR family regulator